MLPRNWEPHTLPPEGDHILSEQRFSAAEHGYLNGFASQQYTLWGELRWTKADGNQKSVAVFAETLQAIELALDVVQDDMTSRDGKRAEAAW